MAYALDEEALVRWSKIHDEKVLLSEAHPVHGSEESPDD